MHHLLFQQPQTTVVGPVVTGTVPMGTVQPGPGLVLLSILFCRWEAKT